MPSNPLGNLYLIPVPLGDSPLELCLPAAAAACARTLRHFVAENAKSARAFLKSLPTDTPIQQIDIHELNEHTKSSELPRLLAPLLEGVDVGLISEAGCPAVADPGANLVALAHQNGVRVIPFVGPCSLLLALMGSGLSGQNFAFHGYLPAKEDARKITLATLEKDSLQHQRTQIFIETPYRNGQMFNTLLHVCRPSTRLCLATNLTTALEHIETHSIAAWRGQKTPEIDKQATVFLFQA